VRDRRGPAHKLIRSSRRRASRLGRRGGCLGLTQRGEQAGTLLLS